MLSGLGLVTNHAPLTNEEDRYLDEFFVFLSMPPSEFYALPQGQREATAALMQTWHLTKLTLTRTATKSS